MTVDPSLETTEARLQALLQSTLQAMVLLDREGRVLAYNQVADDWSRRVMGRSHREGVRFEEHVAGFAVDIDVLRSHLDRALAGEVVQADSQVRDREGHTRWYRTHFSPVTTDRGVVGVALTVADFTEVSEALAALRESEHRLELALDGSGLGLWDWDMVNQRMIFDRRLLASLGLPLDRTDWPIDEASALTHPDDLAESGRLLEDVVAGRVPVFQQEVRARHASGTWKWVLSRGKVTESDADGCPLRMVGTFLDIDQRVRSDAERERLAEDLRQAQKMEAIGRLAGGIAHDFNNLLTAISCNAEVAQRRLPVGDPAGRAIEELSHAVDRASELTAQLLAFGRKQVLNVQLLSLDQVVTGLETILRRLLPENIAVEVRCGAGESAVRGDVSQIEQVLMNLALNARDAMPEGGRLSIVTEVKEVAEGGSPAGDQAGVTTPTPAAGRYVVLSVSDSGQGIPVESLPHVFEPFFTTKEPGRGTGLGLSTVYGIVRQHGGTVVCDSSPGSGADFRVFLPWAADVAAPATAGATGMAEVPRRAHRPGPPAVRATLLVVEDESMVRGVLCELLRESGYQVLEATCAGEALDLARDHTGDIDLLLSDVVMPDQSGIQLADQLTDERPDLEVLLVSGYPDDHALAELGAGRHFLAKPYTPAEILEKVQQILGR